MYKRTSLCLDVIGIITQFISDKKTFFHLYSLSKATRCYYHQTPIVTKNIIFHLKKKFSTKEDINAFKKLDLSYVYHLNLRFRKRKAEKFNNLPLIKGIFDDDWFFDVFKGLGVLNLTGQYIQKYEDISSGDDEKEYSAATDGLKFEKFGNFLRNISKLKNNSISVKFYNGFFDGSIGTIKKLPKNYLKDCVISSISSLSIDFYISTESFITLLEKLPNLKALHLIKNELDDTKLPFPIVLSEVLYVHKRLRTFKCRGNMNSKDVLCIPKIFPGLTDLEYYIYGSHAIINEENGKIFAEQLKNLEKLSIECDGYSIFPFSKGLEILNNALLFPNLQKLDVAMNRDCFKNDGLLKVRESYESLKFNSNCYKSLVEIDLETLSYIVIPFFAFALKTFSQLRKLTISDDEEEDFTYKKNCKIISSLLSDSGNGNAIKSKNIEVFDVMFSHFQRDFVKIIIDIIFNLKCVKNIDCYLANDGNATNLEDLKFEEYYMKWKDNILITLTEGNKLHNVVEVSMVVENLSLESFLHLWNNVPNVKDFRITENYERDSYSMYPSIESLKGIPFSYNKHLHTLDMSFLPSTLFVACLCNSQVETASFYHKKWDFKASDLKVISSKIQEFPQLKNIDISGIKELGSDFFQFAFTTMKNLEKVIFERLSSTVENFVKIFENFKKLKEFGCNSLVPQINTKTNVVLRLPLHENVLNINFYGTFLYETKNERMKKKHVNKSGVQNTTATKIPEEKDYVVEQMLIKFVNLENLNLLSCIGGFPEFSKILKNIKRPVLDKMKVINLDAKMGECTFDDINLILKKFPNLEELEILSRIIVSKKEKVSFHNFLHKNLKLINFENCSNGSNIEKNIKAMIKSCINLKEISLFPKWTEDIKKLEDYAQKIGRDIDFES